MPILLNVKDLEPGMCLAKNVTNQFNILLTQGRRLNENDIAALQRRFPELMVHVGDPVLDDAIEFQDDSHDTEVSHTVRSQISNMTKKVSGSIRSGVALQSEHIAGIQDTLDEMLNYLQDNPVTMAIIEKYGFGDDYLQEHTANVFYISLVLGNTIKNYIKSERERLTAAKSLSNAMNLTPLATAALFFDLGMIPLEHLMKKNEPLTPDEVDAIRNHPIDSANLLPNSLDPMVRLTITCHHENQDGSGYPTGLPGEKITIFARILRIADAFCAATAEKVYRKAKSPIKIMHEMLHGPYQRYYDPVVLKVFAGIMQPLPIGAKLQMDNGCCGVVVRQDSKSPFNPEIILAYDEFGDPINDISPNNIFKLSDRDDIDVVSFGEEDISFLNNYATWITNPQEEAEKLADKPVETLDMMYP